MRHRTDAAARRAGRWTADPREVLPDGDVVHHLDIEIVFLYPWAVHFDALGVFGLAAMAVFVFNVSVAYVYEWRRGGLSWD